MKNGNMLGLLILLATLGAFVSSGYAAVDCVDGCYTKWTAQISSGKCYIFDPYNCVDGGVYRFPQDDHGECEPVDAWDPEQEFEYWDCPTSYCDAECNNCGGGQLCLYSRQKPYDNSCYFYDDKPRKKCSGHC